MISSNVSSLMSNQTYMNNNANSETQNGATKANTSMATSNGSEKSQTDLSKELTDQVTIEKVAQSNVQAIRTQDEMLGSLLDIRG